jgi:2,5-dihydroxypyridine 5,6-dioxygenase
MQACNLNCGQMRADADSHAASCLLLSADQPNNGQQKRHTQMSTIQQAPGRHTDMLFIEELKLCKVGQGQKVVVLTEGDQFKERALRFSSAVGELGARAIAVDIGSGGPSLTPNEHLAVLGQNNLRDDRAMALMKEADMVIDLAMFTFSPQLVDVLSAGTRVLLVVEPSETLERLFPPQTIRNRVEASGRRLKSARALRFTNSVGTDER